MWNLITLTQAELQIIYEIRTTCLTLIAPDTQAILHSSPKVYCILYYILYLHRKYTAPETPSQGQWPQVMFLIGIILDTEHDLGSLTLTQGLQDRIL